MRIPITLHASAFCLMALSLFPNGVFSASNDSTTNFFTTRDGTTYAYDFAPAQGLKVTFLFLHGFPSSRKDWEQQIEAVSAQGFGAIAPDMLGFGSSDLPADPEDYKGRRLADHLTELLDSKNLGTVIGVGHDWGSVILSRVAMFHRDRLEKLAFLNVGYQPGGFVDVDAVNTMGLNNWGYMPYGYWYFFDRYDASTIIKSHLDSFRNLVFPENHTIWQAHFAPVGAARAWLSADTRTQDPLFMTETYKANWKNFLSRPNAIESGLNCYRSQLRGVNVADDAKLTDEDRKLRLPVLNILGALDPVARPDITIDQTNKWVLGGFENKILQGGHWLALELPNEVSELLLEFGIREE